MIIHQPSHVFHFNLLKRKVLLRIKFLFAIFLINSLFISSTLLAQVGPGTANVNIPTGGFQIEGDLQANTPLAGKGDWLPGLSGAGGNVLDAAGNPLNTSTTFHLTDPYNIAENNFSGGKKFNDNPNIWTWVTNPALAKCDINNAMFHFTTSIVSGQVHTWLIVAADRRSNSGSAYIDFEFYQNTLTANANGTFSSAGPNGGRTAGDLLLTLALTNGGGTAEFFVNRWQNTTGTAYDYVDKTSVTPAGAVLASTNAGTVPVSFSAFGLNTYSSNLFVEAAIDLTALFGAIDPCTSLGVKTLFVKTKTSPSPTATIVDFITPKQVQLQLGLANAGTDQSQCGNTFSVTGSATPSPGDAVSSTVWSVVSGSANITSPSSATTGITVTGSPATLRFTVNTIRGCTVFDDVVLTILPPPAANAGADVTVNCTTPSATLTATGGGSYSWSPGGATTASITVSPAATTTYTVTVTGANGCTATDAVTVTVDKAVPAANAGADVTVNCTTPGTILTATGGGSYSWSPGGATTASITVSPAATTTYTVTVTGANGCTATDAVTVTVDKAVPAANAGADVTVNCTTPSTTLTATGGGSYSWSPGGATTASITVSPAATTTYTVTVTGANGCTATDAVTVTVDKAVPAANAGADVTINCATPSTTLAATGGGSYSWSPATGLSATNIANPVATPASTTTYTVTVTAANGCTATDAVTVTVDKAVPVANAGADVTINCTTPSATLAATGGGSYSWSPATGLSATNIANPVANPASTTTYTVTVTGANGCTATDAVTVTVDKAVPVANAGVDVTINCTTPSATLAATGGGSYSWSPATGLSATNIANPVATPTSTTTYTVTVTAANGCAATDAVTVTVDNAPVTANAGDDFIKTCVSNASGKQIGETGDAGFTYSWLPADGLNDANISNPIANPSSTTTYTVTKTNTSSGCFATDAVTVTVNNTAPSISSVCVVQPTLCSKGSITINATGGSGIQYSIDGVNFVSSNVFNNLNPGDVTGLYLINAAGCTSAAPILCADIVDGCTTPRAITTSGTVQLDDATNIKSPAASLSKDEGLTVKAYPNPFQHSINFRFTSPISGKAVMEVYDITGKRIDIVFDGMVKAGVTNSVRFNAAGKSAGMFVYKLNVDGKVIRGKIQQIQ